jgi:hypothetical protein
LAVIDSTNVTWGGSTCSIPLGESFCDSIALQLDTAHDYWIALHGTSTATLKVITPPPADIAGGGFATGDQTGVTTIPTAGISQEFGASRIVAS